MGTDVQELAARAKRLLLERDFAEAVRACRRLLLSRPDDVDTRLLLGRALIATERVDEARVEMMSLIRRHPEKSVAHRLLGESFLKASQPKRAEESLRKALELDPEDEEATELLEELAEHPPPVSATVERWFDSAGVATIETPASFFDDGSENRPATSPAQEAPPSIQIDPELAAMATGLAALKGEDTITSADILEPEEADPSTDPDAASPPPRAGANPVAPSTDEHPTAPARPNPDDGGREPRRPKATMMGMAGLGSTAPIQPEKTSELALDELEQVDEGSSPEVGSSPELLQLEVPQLEAKNATSELDASELEQVDAGSGSEKGFRPGVRGPAPAAKNTTSELNASELEMVDSKPVFVPLNDEPLDAEVTSGGLPPLEEEATRLRESHADRDDSTRDVKMRRVPISSELAVPGAAQRPVTLPPPPGPAAAAAPPAALRPSAAPFSAAMPAGPPIAGPPLGVSSPPIAAPPVAGSLPGSPPIAGPPLGVSSPPIAAPPVAASLPGGPPIAGPPLGVSSPPIAAPPVAAAPFPAPGTPAAFSPIAAPATPAAFSPIAAPPMAGDAGGMGFGGARVVTPAFGMPAASPAPAPAAPPSSPSMPTDFTPGAGPRPSGPQRRALSTTASARALAWSSRLSELWARALLLRDRLPNPKLFPLLVATPFVLFALVIVAAMAISDHTDEQEIAAAVLTACDDSRSINIDRAIARDADENDSDDESVARRAHLFALSAYESGSDAHRHRAAELLQSLDDTGRAGIEARLASAYLSLAAGDVEAADSALAVRQAAEDPSGEVGHVHALVAMARGNYSHAAVEARAAVTQRASSPRHRALLALGQAFDHHAEGALVDLSAQPGSTNDPAILDAEARIRRLKGDVAGAETAASTLVEELASVAHPRQRAWARVVLASLALTGGDPSAALTQLTAGRDEDVAGDEWLTLSLASSFAEAGDVASAQALLASLPEASARPQERAQVRVAVLLEAGDQNGARAALANAGDGPRSAYLRGRVAEAQGDAAGARRAYEAAMADAGEEIHARVRLGAMILRTGDAAGAMTVLGPALERAPTDVELVPVLVQVLLTTDGADRAAQIVEAALSARPGAYVLTLASARVALARGRAEAAQATLETLTTNHPHDANAWALLGEAARAASQTDRAKEAFEKALEIQPGHVDALLGLLDLAIASSDAAAGHEALDRAATAGVTGRPLEIGRARLMVLEGGGAQAVPTLRTLSRRSGDPILFAALGQAYLQAEDSRRAGRAFSRALRYDRNFLDAHLGLATIGVHAGGSRLRRAAARIGTAARIVRAQGNRPRDQARLLTLRAAVLYFGNGDMAGAAEQARAAIALDPTVGEAHLLLAIVLSEQGRPAQDELRAAISCPAPPPEAFIRLAVGGGSDACELAQRYLTAAPRGSWASDARSIRNRCR